MGKSQQRKGADGERELAEQLRQYGYEIRRGGSLSFGEVPDLVGLPGVHIECKRVEKLRLDEAMQQAITDAERFHDGIPIVFHRKNRRPWLITMRLEDFMELYKQKEYKMKTSEELMKQIDCEIEKAKLAVATEPSKEAVDALASLRASQSKSVGDYMALRDMYGSNYKIAKAINSIAMENDVNFRCGNQDQDRLEALIGFRELLIKGVTSASVLAYIDSMIKN